MTKKTPKPGFSRLGINAKRKLTLRRAIHDMGNPCGAQIAAGMGEQGTSALVLQDLGFNVFTSSGESWGEKYGKCLFFRRNLSSGVCFDMCIPEGQPLPVLPE